MTIVSKLTINMAMEMNQVSDNCRNKKNRAGAGLALGIGIGVGIGAAIGAATGDMGMWTAIGIGLGAAVGMALGTHHHKKKNF